MDETSGGLQFADYVRAVLFGAVGAMGGVLIWTLVSLTMQAELGPAVFAVGLCSGFAVALAVQGVRRSWVFAWVALGCALPGVVIGAFLSVCAFLAGQNAEPFFTFLGQVQFSRLLRIAERSCGKSDVAFMAGALVLAAALGMTRIKKRSKTENASDARAAERRANTAIADDGRLPSSDPETTPQPVVARRRRRKGDVVYSIPTTLTPRPSQTRASDSMSRPGDDESDAIPLRVERRATKTRILHTSATPSETDGDTPRRRATDKKKRESEVVE